MSLRSSKRLKSAAGAVATVLSATVSTTTTTVTSKRKTSSSLAKKPIINKSKKSTSSEEDQTSNLTVSPEENADKNASKASEKKKETKDAWNALFKKKDSSSSQRSSPKAAQAISIELQEKIDSYTKFDGVTSVTNANHLKIVAWNVNGLRAVLKKADGVHVRAYVTQENPDILCLSETKICKDELQKLENFLPQYAHQYWSCAVKKGYAGTVIFSKTKPLSIKDEIIIQGKSVDQEGRFLALEYDTFWLVHTYVPNAGMKLDRLDYRTKEWDVAMLRMLKDLEKTKPVIWCGDLNVAHQEIDIHDPKHNRNKSPGFTDAERESFGNILANGFVDTFRHFHPKEQTFSYFSYRFNARAKNKGWRLDYFVVSEALLATVEKSYIRTGVDGSDHVPVGIELIAN